jgi:L-rhamnonate dehydratase
VVQGDRIIRLEWAVLEGRRPLALGRNARLPPHGAAVTVPLCRLTTEDGLVGVGLSRLDVEVAKEALGLPFHEMFSERGTGDRWLSLDYPLWDLAARREGVPVYRLLLGHGADRRGVNGPLLVDCYDTSFYFSEPEPPRQEPEELRAQALASYGRGHRAFKVKVGRGGRWMEPDTGLDRDVAVVDAVRDAIGPGSALFADANNGFTLNGAKEFLARTASFGIGWLEEPFHEDRVLLAALREWMAREYVRVLLADGESATSDDAYKLACEGALDVVQCDILHTGFTRWLKLGRALDAMGIASAPHHFGLYLGNYVSGHLAAAVQGLRYIEWDEATVPGVSTPGYKFSDGRLRVSDDPGFGIEVDEELFVQAVKSTGFELRIGPS